MKQPIRILVVDDHAITRLGITALLETEPDFTVVGQAEDGEVAVREVQATRPDIVIMDLMMPKMDGLEATGRILASHPDVKIVILTTFGDSDAIGHALEIGAAGAVMKNTNTDEFPTIIRAIAAGQRVVAPEIEKMLATNPPLPSLTERQKDILVSVTHGLSNKDIAKQFDITSDCVKDHIAAIMTKIGAANRAEAVGIALRKHLLKI